jgi:hypothetical protein
MRNFVGDLIIAYYQCLNGNITYNGQEVNVYNVGVDASDKFHYIHLRPESESDASNKSSFVTSPVVVMDIVTVHDGSIDASVVENIDDQVRQLIFTARNTVGIVVNDDFQLLNVIAQNSSYLDGFDGT